MKRIEKDPKVHWLSSSDAEKASCGEGSLDSLYSSAKDRQFVTCKLCLKIARAALEESK